LRKIAYLLGSVVAVLGLALGGASAASASTAAPAVHAGTPAAVTPAGTTDGEAGYEVTGLGQIYRQGAETFTVTSAMAALGSTANLTTPEGAIGLGGCNTGTGQAAEVGVLNLKSGGFSVADAVGGLPANGADPCRDNGILTDGSIVHPLLTNIPAGENLTIEWVEYAKGTGFYVSLNSGPDINTGEAFSYYYSFATQVWVPGRWVDCHDGKHGRVCTWKRGHWKTVFVHPYYNAGLYGTMADSSLLGGGSPGDFADVYGVSLNYATPDSSTQFVRPVYSSADGVSPWLIGPDNDPADSSGFKCTASQPFGGKTYLGTSSGSFTICADQAVGA
jgi:hypothetical protein